MEKETKNKRLRSERGGDEVSYGTGVEIGEMMMGGGNG